MKLNGLSVDRYGICNNLKLNDFDDGFNLVYGGNGTGKSTLTRFIRNTIFGYGPNSEATEGFLEVFSDGCYSKVTRRAETSDRLVHLDVESRLDANNRRSKFIPVSIDSIGPEVFDAAFLVDGRKAIQNASELASLLTLKFNVPIGNSAIRDDAEFDRMSCLKTELLARLDTLTRSIANLESEQNENARRIENEQSTSQSRRHDTENRLREVSQKISSINFSALRNQTESLDREIADLRIQIETSEDRVEYVSRPYKQSDGPSILYRRLDDIDNQIRRWRSVHTDVQDQRVALKDEMLVWNEMSIDSSRHPYNRSREILQEIESTVSTAESSINDFRTTNRVHDSQLSTSMADQLFQLCGQIRGGLYALCDELGAQYKSVRHRSAAAELKRLRRCYHEIGENIESLINHRQMIVEEIQQIDPAGGLAVARADNDFCSCAQHEGYLQARRKFVGEIANSEISKEVVRAEVTSETSRLRELENQRAAKVRELVAMENSSSELETHRKQLTDELRGYETTIDMAPLRAQNEKTQIELNARIDERKKLNNELDRFQDYRPNPANPLIAFANDCVGRLTRGEIQKLWLSPLSGDSNRNCGIVAEDRLGKQFSFSDLSSGIQQQVVLSLCMAIVDHFRRSGIAMPMLLDDVFVNLDPELIRATYKTLTEFSGPGNQIVALTSDQTVLELARNDRMTVMDLPDTHVSPVVPMWSPDRTPVSPPREPEFLTPFTTRHHVAIPERPISYPQVKYPETGSRIDHSSACFDSGPIAESRSFERPDVLNEVVLSDETELTTMRLVDNDQADRLRELGVTTVGQLLAINPNELSDRFTSSRLSQNEIDRWQSIAWLMMCVPGLQVDDAMILHALGICEPEQLESTHSQQLIDRISRYLNSSDSQQFADRNRSFNRNTISRWYDSLSRTRSHWRMPSGYSRRNRWRQSYSEDRSDRTSRSRREYDTSRENRPRRDRRNRSDRNDNVTARFSRQNDRTSSLRIRETQEKAVRRSENTETTKLKFYLNLDNQLEAAPSIGPKTAERFAKISVQTVGEFLAQTSESMATKINYKRITADVIRLWQHQARLVCRVPNLRGHDAQLLVACGITEPEDLANRSPNKLFSIVEPFSESKEGLKIIRGGKQPDLEEINNWVSWAQQTRSLQAA